MKDDKNLKHSGVKGMKWGHRRYQNKDGSLTVLGRLHYSKYDKYEKSYDKNTNTDDLKSKFNSVSTKPLDVNDNVVNKYKLAVKKQYGLVVSKTNDKKYNIATINKDKNKDDREVVDAEVVDGPKSQKTKEKKYDFDPKDKIIDADDLVTVKDTESTKNTKKAKETEQPEETVKKANENKKNKDKDKEKGPGGPDGPDGPDIPNKESNKPKKSFDFSKASGVAATTAKTLGNAEKVNAAIAKIRNKKQTREEMASMDNKQLQEKITRLNLEQQYSNLTANRMSKGHTYVKNVLDVAVPLAEVTSSVLAIAGLFQKLKK